MVPSVVAAGLWMTFCLCVTGRPLPNTFYAKAVFVPTSGSEHLFSLIPLFIEDCFCFLSDSSPLLPAAAVFAVVAALLFRRGQKTALAFILPACLIIGVWISRPLPQVVQAFYWERYLIPALGYVYILIGISTGALWKKGPAARAAAAVMFLAVLAGSLLCLPDKLKRYEKNCADIARYNIAAGKWISQNTGPVDKIAVIDAGALKYFGKRKTIDIYGLNDQRFSDLSFLNDRIDVFDAETLAAYADADWLVAPLRHFGAKGAFTIAHNISYSDYSIYIHPEPFTLLLLKKSGL